MLSTATERLIQPARNIQGSLRLPGDKSISHRYALLGGLAEGTTRLSNFSTGADCASSLACVEALGAKVVRDGSNIEITGTAGDFHPPASPPPKSRRIPPHRGRLALPPPHGAHPQAPRPDGRTTRPH